MSEPKKSLLQDMIEGMAASKNRQQSPGMSQERTEQRYTDQQMRDALQRLIEGKHSLHIPPLPEDEDFVIAAAIDEALKSRAHIAGLRATAQERDKYIENLTSRQIALGADLDKRDKEIDWHMSELADREAEIIRQRERGDRLDSELHKQNCRNQDQAEEIERLNIKCANLEGHNEKLHELANTAVKEQEYAKRKAIEYNDLSVKQSEEIDRLRAALTDARDDLYIVASAGYHEAMVKEADEAAARIAAALKGAE